MDQSGTAPEAVCTFPIPVYGWRRLHGRHAVAQVDPVAGLEGWQMRVWLPDNPTVLVRLPRFFEQLISAQAKADDLARKTFGTPAT